MSLSSVASLNLKPISAGYVKRGEMATEEDAIILGLAPSDADKIFICDRDGNLAMFHFKDAEEGALRACSSGSALGCSAATQPHDGSVFASTRPISPAISSASEDCLPGGLFASTPSPPPRSSSQVDLTASIEGNLTPNEGEILAAGPNIQQPRGRQADEEIRNPSINLVRGWIVNIETGQLVCKSFSEGSVVYVDPANFLTQHCWDQWEFKPYREGTTIRIFWDQGEWKFLTHRKIDASTSRISGVEVEISTIFAEACPDFSYDLLSTDVIYVLQIVHRDNQIMNPHPIDKPYVCHLASISAASTPEPMQLIALDTVPRIPCFTYLDRLGRTGAAELLANNECIIARRGYEIIQVAPQSLAKLMEIRGCSTAPYIPPPLMYLRLSEEDRPLLFYAVPHHIKPLVTTEVMAAYIHEHSHRLAHFCACALQAKIFTTGLPLTKTLKWFVNDMHLDNKHAPFEQIYELFMAKIVKLVATNGTTAYRCFRDVEDTNSKLLKLAAKHPEVSAENQEKPKSSKQRRQPRKPKDAPTKNSNGPRKVTIKDDAKVKVPAKKPFTKKEPGPKKEKADGETLKKPISREKGIDRRIIKKEFIIGTDPDESIAEDFFGPSKPRAKK